MNDNNLIRNEYTLAIYEFKRELERIDKKYSTFAKIEIESESIYQIGFPFPTSYLRDITLEEIIIT